MNGLLRIAEKLALNGDYFSLAVALTACGTVLIVVNTLTHAIRERMNERRRHRQIVERHLTPLLAAASDLISRISEILVFQRPTTLRDIGAYDGIDSLCPLRPDAMNRHATTVYRLVKFFAASRKFQRATAGIPLYSRLRHVNYYLERKLPTAFKGNLYDSEGIPKEVQEAMGDQLLDGDNDAISHLSVLDFCEAVNAGDFDRELLEHAFVLFSLEADLVRDHKEIDRNAPEWCRVLAMAHLCVYLIDFFQDLAKNPRWEEYRVFLASLVLHWNNGSVAPRYFYAEGDADPAGPDYLDTYSERLVWHHPIFVLGSKLPFWPKGRRVFRRLARRLVLRRRGRRYIGAHPGKRVSNVGLQIEGESATVLDWSKDVGSIHDSVRYYLKMRGLVAEKI